MRIRPYIACRDCSIIKEWITDDRIHALWCANRMAYPPDAAGITALLRDHAEKYGDVPFVAEEGGRPVGFFCIAVYPETNEAMLRFVVVDNNLRGHGYGRQMLDLALKFAFDITGVEAVRLNVFDVNTTARKCYTSVGFKEESLTENAFAFKDEKWGRCSMVIRRDQTF